MSWWFIAASLLLAGAARSLWRLMWTVDVRLRRLLGMLFGACFGLSCSLPVAVALNPLVGLDRSSPHNVVILAICLGFLGVIVGSLGGLACGGMILSPQPRINTDRIAPASFSSYLEELTPKSAGAAPHEAEGDSRTQEVPS
jgi:hypothetical protein